MNTADDIRAGMAAIADKQTRATKEELALGRAALHDVFDEIAARLNRGEIEAVKEVIEKLRVIVDHMFAQAEASAPETRS